MIIAAYEEISGLTGEMLLAARTGDWDLLSELEARCSARVDSLRKGGESEIRLERPEREHKVRLINKILADDREIRALSEPWMAKLSALINSASTERKLTHAYGLIQSG